MIPSKYKIEIEDGKIKRVFPSQAGVELNLDGNEIFFENCYVLPGLVDSHLHFFGIGEVSMMPDFRNCCSEAEMIDLIKQKTFKRGDWIVGFGWNQENFPENRYPIKSYFDEAFPVTPIFLKRIDGHSALINSKAAEILNLNEHSIPPSGGIIQKNSDGSLNGILIDTAMDIVLNSLPFYDREQVFSILNYSQNYLSELGLTEIIDMDLEPRLIEYLKEFDSLGNLVIRVNSFVKAHNDEYIDFIEKPYSGKNFSVKGIKLYADGALGSRGAALKNEYADMENEFGLLLIETDLMKKKIESALDKGFSVAVHSIGDRGSELVLKVFNSILCSYRIKSIQKRFEQTGEYPFRLEHCQVISESDLSGFANGLIAASVQPIHFLSDTENGMAQKRLGIYRMSDAYRWKSLSLSGGLLLSGSDAPIESPNPFLGISALVDSKERSENLSLDEAIETYCLNPHKSLGNHLNRGKIASGFNADLTVIRMSQNISESEVLCTIVEGKIIYKSKNK